MAKKKNDKFWQIAKEKFKLNDRQIKMARELGMNPKKFGSKTANKFESWKMPLGQFIEKCYFKQFKK